MRSFRQRSVSAENQRTCSESLHPTRSVVKQKITPCKTEASRKPIPLDAELAEVLFRWRLQCPYPQSGDWVFVSPHRKGRQPYWPGSLFRAHLKPALQAAKIPGNVGWHTLRHTFGTLMKANGEDIKTIQELLRHSNYKVTADTYTQAVTPTKRAAQTQLVKMILLPGKKKAGERASASDLLLSNPFENKTLSDFALLRQ